jgi:hypothetical protein
MRLILRLVFWITLLWRVLMAISAVSPHLLHISCPALMIALQKAQQDQSPLLLLVELSSCACLNRVVVGRFDL